MTDEEIIRKCTRRKVGAFTEGVMWLALSLFLTLCIGGLYLFASAVIDECMRIHPGWYCLLTTGV